MTEDPGASPPTEAPADEPAGDEPAGATDDPRLMWRVLGALYLAGAAGGALSLLFPHPEYFDEAALWSNIAIAAAGGVGALAVASWLPAWPVHILLAAGTLVITRAVYYSDEPIGFYTFWYLWVALYAFFFFDTARAFAHWALVGITYGWLLVELDPGAEVSRWTQLVLPVAAGGLMVGALANRLRRTAADSATIARERADLMEKLEHVARTDELTGLANRRSWDEQLAREMDRARRDETPLSVGMLDLDRFKNYNDAHGHQGGDRMLKELAAAWREQLRTTDVLARYGGEEFSLALPGCDLDDARLLVERLRAACGGRGATCSAGIALFDGKEGSDSLLGRADRALYEAKAAGRDRIVAA